MPQNVVKRTLQTSRGVEIFNRDVENTCVTVRASYVDVNLTIDAPS